MRAISQDVLGGPEVLKEIELPRPEPGPTEVLVRVHAAGLNPTDWKHRANGGFLGKPPFVLGWDVSGVVEEVRTFVPKPAGVDHVQAGALPLAALTAWQALVDTAGVRSGQRVLVHAAAGGVGHLAVQIAKARGAHVIGTASAAKHDFLRSLGADELIDYRTEDFTALRDVDVVLDTIGGDYGPRSLETLRPGGSLVSIVLSRVDEELAAKALGLRARVRNMLVEPDHAAMKAIAALVTADRLRAEIAAVLPLEEAAKAHALGETNRTTGKIVLEVGPSTAK